MQSKRWTSTGWFAHHSTSLHVSMRDWIPVVSMCELNVCERQSKRHPSWLKIHCRKVQNNCVQNRLQFVDFLICNGPMKTWARVIPRSIRRLDFAHILFTLRMSLNLFNEGDVNQWRVRVYKTLFKLVDDNSGRWSMDPDLGVCYAIGFQWDIHLKRHSMILRRSRPGRAWQPDPEWHELLPRICQR